MRFAKALLVPLLIAGLLALSGTASAQEPALLPLDEALPAAIAVNTLGPEVVAAIAAHNELTVPALTNLANADLTAWIAVSGDLYFIDPSPPGGAFADDPPAAGPFPNGQTFLLHSRPGSDRVIYLDFDGYELPNGTLWNNGAAFSALPLDLDGNPATFNQTEHDTIQSMWLRIAEDYAPFDVDVTTQDPGYAAINRSSMTDAQYGTRLVVTDSPDTAICASPCGGVSFVGNFDRIGSEHDIRQPSWTFFNSTGGTAKGAAEASSHEVGHSVGLFHDGQNPNTAYYLGHNGWAPIMGVGYLEPLTQWSKGEYSQANNTQDDLLVMAANGISWVADDAGQSIPATNALTPGASQLIGIAAGTADIDTFSFAAPCAGLHTITASPAAVSANLNIELALFDNAGTQLALHDPPIVDLGRDAITGLDATVGASLDSGASYTVRVRGTGQGTATNGWTAYASIGQYTLDVSVQCGCTNDNVAGALDLGPLPAATIDDNSCATGQAAETASGPINTLWYTFVAASTGSATVSTCSASTDFDTWLGVYSPNQLLAFDDNPTGAGEDRCGLNSTYTQVTLPVTGGNLYYVQVDGARAATGTFELTVAQHACGGVAATQVGSTADDTWLALPSGAVVVGLQGADTMAAASGAVRLCGETGADDLRGAAGADVLFGGPGNDSLRGFGGADRLFGGGNNDTVRGGSGDDELDGGTGDDVIIAGAGIDSAIGGEGIDSINGGADADLVSGGPGADAIRGQGGDDQLLGDEGNDLVRGQGGDDVLRGGTGQDTLLASSGNDDLFGDGGDDTLWAGTGADELDGGAGTADFCHGGSDSDTDNDTNCEIRNKLP